MKRTSTHILSMTLAQLAQRALPALVALVLAPSLLSCSKQEGAPAVLSGDDAIAISDPAFEEETKGVATDASYVNTNGFAMAAIQNYTGTGTNVWYINPGTAVTKSGSAWTIAGTPRWPATGNLSFFFYTNKNSSDNGSLSFVQNTTGMPGLTYTPSTTNISKQSDICVGTPVMNRTKSGGAVDVAFTHALTQIVFSADYSGNLPAGQFILIDTIKIKNVVGTNTGTWRNSSPIFVWNTNSLQYNTSYQITRNGGHFVADSVRQHTSSTPAQVSSQNGIMYLLPQGFNAVGGGTGVVVSYGIYSNTLGSPVLVRKYTTNQVSFPAAYPWEIGKCMNYNLTINVQPDTPSATTSLTLNCSVGGWTDIHNVIGNSHLE